MLHIFPSVFIALIENAGCWSSTKYKFSWEIHSELQVFRGGTFCFKAYKITGAYCILLLFLFFPFTSPVGILLSEDPDPFSFGRSLGLIILLSLLQPVASTTTCSVQTALFVLFSRKSGVYCNYRIILGGTSLHFFPAAATVRLRADFFQ